MPQFHTGERVRVTNFNHPQHGKLGTVRQVYDTYTEVLVDGYDGGAFQVNPDEIVLVGDVEVENPQASNEPYHTPDADEVRQAEADVQEEEEVEQQSEEEGSEVEIPQASSEGSGEVEVRKSGENDPSADTDLLTELENTPVDNSEKAEVVYDTGDGPKAAPEDKPRYSF